MRLHLVGTEYMDRSGKSTSTWPRLGAAGHARPVVVDTVTAGPAPATLTAATEMLYSVSARRPLNSYQVPASRVVTVVTVAPSVMLSS